MRRFVLAVVMLAGSAAVSTNAHAERHVMQPGETLEHVARTYGCSIDAVLRANHRDNTLVPAGRVVVVPACKRRPSHRAPAGKLDDGERARRALAVIDGVAVVPRARHADIPTVPEPKRSGRPSASIGQPWDGRLENGRPLIEREGYRVRRPHKAFGADHVIGHLQRAIALVRARYPRVHTLAIGDLSAQHGGPLDRHRSHQSGLDVDVGLYFTKLPRGYPESFAPANTDLDLEATWAIIDAFARTAGTPGGVQVIFLDRSVQARLYRWARARGRSDDELARLLQYPRTTDTLAGLVRHWPSHLDHLHVRFTPYEAFTP